MNAELIKEISKMSMGSIAVAGLIWVLHAAVSDDAAKESFLQDHMARQTAALEKLVLVYTGGK